MVHAKELSKDTFKKNCTPFDVMFVPYRAILLNSLLNCKFYRMPNNLKTKLSLLSALLVASSGVIATIVPSKAGRTEDKNIQFGSHTRNSILNAGGLGGDPSITCTVDTNTVVCPCDISESGTTGSFGDTSNDEDEGDGQVDPNTTDC